MHQIQLQCRPIIIIIIIQITNVITNYVVALQKASSESCHIIHVPRIVSNRIIAQRSIFRLISGSIIIIIIVVVVVINRSFNQ